MEIPQSFYYLIGTLIIANLGTIGTLIGFAGKALWYLAKLDSKVEKNIQDTNAAHDKIRDLRDDVKRHVNPMI